MTKSWLADEKLYEGFPLLLRRPAELDTISLKSIFPILAVITHEFTKRLANGLPEPEYNRGLADLDHELISAFDSPKLGVIALVETFGGERNYYYYVLTNANVPNIISLITERYPNERLSWSTRQDATWDFIEKYALKHF